MKKAALFIFILLLCPLLWAQNRYALIIGNANYPRAEDRLPNAINDTNDISAALRGLGFNVELKQNLQRIDMVREISAFITRLRSDRNSEGFFWYAGHAMEIEGVNLLLPLDVNVENDELIRATSYSVTDLTRQLGEVRNKVNVVVLDACRVPPSSGGSRSTGDTSRVIKTVALTVPDLFVIFSTAPGTVALDGAGRNSPFAEAFLMNIRSIEPLTIMTGHVTSDTLSLTNQRQRPYISGSMGRENIYYSLNPSGVQPPPNPNPAPVPVPPSPNSIANNMVRINGGTFLMGLPNRQGERRRVTLSSFLIGKYEVTQREWFEIMGTTVRQMDPTPELRRDGWYGYRSVDRIGEGDNYPMYYVSWYDAVEFCNRLSQREGLTPAYTIDKSGRWNYVHEQDTVLWTVSWNRNANGYRLPTEAEWQYAYLAGTTGVIGVESDFPEGGAVDDFEPLVPVGETPVNAWGLYGFFDWQLSEWCWDAKSTYSGDEPPDADDGLMRVICNGRRRYDPSLPSDLRPAVISNGSPKVPSYRDYRLSFRIARNAQ